MGHEVVSDTVRRRGLRVVVGTVSGTVAIATNDLASRVADPALWQDGARFPAEVLGIGAVGAAVAMAVESRIRLEREPERRIGRGVLLAASVAMAALGAVQGFRCAPLFYHLLGLQELPAEVYSGVVALAGALFIRSLLAPRVWVLRTRTESGGGPRSGPSAPRPPRTIRSRRLSRPGVGISARALL